MRATAAIPLVVSIACATLMPASAVTLDGYAAAVNDRIITVGDVTEQMRRSNRDYFMSLRNGQAPSAEKMEELYKQARDELIAEALIVEEFEKMEEDEKVALPEDAVDKRIQDLIRDRYDGDRGQLLRDLQKSGMSFAEYKKTQRESIIMAIMHNQELGGKISVSPGEVRKLYNERKNQFVTPAEAEISLMSFDLEDEDADRSEKMATVKEILKRVRAGSDFADIAESESEGSRADEGGYRGWMEISDLRSELRKAIKNMKAGQVSDVIIAGDTAYIIKLHDRHEAGVQPLEEVADILRDELLREERARLMDIWTEQLAEKHYVKRYPLPEQF